MIKVHATCVEVDGAAVLLRGPSGSGKSDLALRLIANGAMLVADDYTNIEEKNARLHTTAPDAIAGMMEVRGIGLVKMPYIAESPLGLVIDLVAPEEVERLPDSKTCEYLGICLPLFKFNAFEASTVAKISLAITSGQ